MISPPKRKSEKRFRLGAWILLILFLSLSNTYHLNAQQYFFDKYSVGEGLAQSTVFDVHQDHNGYVWLGTRAGVSRFSGLDFINYNKEDGMAENGVRVIFRDTKNNLWFGHVGGGISKYNGLSFSVFSSAGEFFDSDITTILSDENDNLWITSESSGTIMVSEISDSLSNSTFDLFIGDDLSDRVFGAFKTTNDNVYFITDAFLKIFNPEKNSFESFYKNGMPGYFQITCMYEDSKNNLWLGTYHGGLYKYIPEEDTSYVFDSRDGLASNWISCITEDNMGNIWVGTWGGGITVMTEKDTITLDNSNGLTDLYIRQITKDYEGNMLIGTDENGLLVSKGIHFTSFFPEHGLIDPQVWSILKDKSGKYWFGTSEGISLYSKDEKKENAFEDFPHLENMQISFLEEAPDSRIWIATETQGIFSYDRITKNFQYHYELNRYLPALKIKAFETDKEGRLWIGTLDGLHIYNFKEQQVYSYTQRKLSIDNLAVGEGDVIELDRNTGLANNDITALHYAPDNVMWIGTRGEGLNYYARNSLSYLSLNESFTARTITSDNEGYLWVGTEAKGVFQIDPVKKDILVNLTESEKLLANLINLIAVDKYNNIYIGTNQGLNIYDPDKSRSYTYNEKNGFTGIETKDGAVYIDQENNLWFGTVKGVTRLDPGLLYHSDREPLTRITHFEVNKIERELDQDMKLRYNENDVFFEYISISLDNPDVVAYRIMLEGADDDWRPVTKQTSVIYPRLAPDEYIFKVTARNSEGKWNDEPVIYKFEILPPFYKTTWFIMLSVFAGALSIFIYVKVRERNLIIEKRILEEKVVERTAVVTAQKEQLARKNKDITDSIRYAKRIQVAILPPEIPFDNTFILFRPKDIVSGDFYWLEEVGNKQYMAAVDCTGHGVPGAFMSIIGSNFLNKIVKEQHVYQPAKILNMLNKEVIDNLKSTNEDTTVYDGMDIALICYDTETEVLEYAGGYNPLILVRSGELQEVKADRFAIGRSSLSQNERNFTNHRIEMKRGDTIYIFTDGYADQFGGEEGKKFKTKPMKELLIAINEKSMEEQRNILNNTIDAWRGDIEQVDDILVIGRSF